MACPRDSGCGPACQAASWGFPEHAKQRKLCTGPGGGTPPGPAGLFPLAHTPVTRLETSGIGGKALESPLQSFPPGIWIWPQWLGAVSQSDQLASGFSLALVSYPPSLRVPFSVRCSHHCARLAGSDPFAEPWGSAWPPGTCRVFLISLWCCLGLAAVDREKPLEQQLAALAAT